MIIWWWKVLLAVSACAAVLASFAFLRDLAIYAGWPEWTAPLLPLSIDTLAAAALTDYLRSRSRTAAAVSAGAIAASVTGNSVSHLIGTGLLMPGHVTDTASTLSTITAWIVVTAVGSVPAVTVGLVVHLIASGGSSWQTQSTAETETGGRTASVDTTECVHSLDTHPGSAAVAAAAASSTSLSPSTRDLALLRSIYEEGLEGLSADRLTSRLNVSKSTAVRLRRLVREGRYRQHRNGSPSAQVGMELPAGVTVEEVINQREKLQEPVA